MGKKKINFSTMLEGTSEIVSDAMRKTKDVAVKVIDQNADGKIDLRDVSEMANVAGNLIKNSAASLKETLDDKSKDLERRALQPIFEDDMDSASFVLPKLIRICERNKKHAESEVCQGSIGSFTDHKDLRIVNIFRENIEAFGVTFFPDRSYEFYYVDPSDRDRYIALDEYFSYLKIERINELQKIAQDLGAKHFRVTYKEEKVSFSSKQVSGQVKATVANAGGSYDSTKNDYSTVEIAAEMECAGHEPVRPTLKYLSKDSSIQNLIEMRMDARAPITHQKFTLKLSNTSGIKENDAIKIDAVLKAFRCSGNVTVASEAKNESRRYLEYEIFF